MTLTPEQIAAIEASYQKMIERTNFGAWECVEAIPSLLAAARENLRLREALNQIRERTGMASIGPLARVCEIAKEALNPQENK